MCLSLSSPSMSSPSVSSPAISAFPSVSAGSAKFSRYYGTIISNMGIGCTRLVVWNPLVFKTWHVTRKLLSVQMAPTPCLKPALYLGTIFYSKCYGKRLIKIKKSFKKSTLLLLFTWQPRYCTRKALYTQQFRIYRISYGKWWSSWFLHVK